MRFGSKLREQDQPRCQWTCGVKIFLHLLMFSVVIPLSGALIFLLHLYLPRQDLSAFQAILSAVFGALLGLPFVFLIGLGFGIALLPGILLLGKTPVLFLHFLAVTVAPWVVAKGDPFFLEHVAFIVIVSVFLAIFSSYVYLKCKIYRLIKHSGL